MYKKVKRDQVPTRERKVASRFEFTTDWKEMKADIDKGLKKVDSCYVEFGPRDWKRIGLSGTPQKGRKTATGCASVRRFIRKYLDDAGLKYKIRIQHVKGRDQIIVSS